MRYARGEGKCLTDVDAKGANLHVYKEFALKNLALGETYAILERDSGRSEEQVMKMACVGFGQRFVTFQTLGGCKRCYNYFDIWKGFVRIGRLTAGMNQEWIGGVNEEIRDGWQ